MQTKGVAPGDNMKLLSKLYLCAKNRDCAGALKVYKDMRSLNRKPKAREISVIISLCAGESSSAAPPYLDEAVAIFREAYEMGVMTPQGQAERGDTESTWSGVMKLHCLAGNVDSVVELLDQMQNAGIAPRLRTISPVIMLAERQGSLALAKRACTILDQCGIDPLAEELLSLAKLHAIVGNASSFNRVLLWMADVFKDCTSPLHKSGFTDDQLDRLAGTFELASACAQETQEDYYAAHDDPASNKAHDDSKTHEESGSNKTHEDSDSGRTNQPSSESGQGWRTFRTQVDESGLSIASGVQLHAIHLLDEERRALCDGIKHIVPRAHARCFAEFVQFVETHGPWDYILDGANIGFYGRGSALQANRRANGAGRQVGAQSASDRKRFLDTREKLFSFEKIMNLVDNIKAQGKKVLVVLHVNHIQGITRDEELSKVISDWKETNLLYTTPRGHNDDWYWLYGAVACGRVCSAITNDEMRDHHFILLHARKFLRWKERHVVHFKFHDRLGREAIILNEPLPYSRVMQRDPSSGVWHVPSGESSDWICATPERISKHRELRRGSV